MFFTNLFFSMSSLRGRFVATIFVIRFSPQKLFGKLIGKLDGKLVGKFVGNVGWKCWLENWLEMLGGNVGWKFGWKFGWKTMLEMLGGNVGWKCWLEMLVGKNVGKLVGKCWLNIWLEKMLVNGCEIIGEKIVATNLPLRLSTTVYYDYMMYCILLNIRMF